MTELERIQASLDQMDSYIKGLGFTSAECRFWIQGRDKILALISGDDSWQKDLSHYERVGRLCWSEFYHAGTDPDQILSDMWTAIYAAKPLDERELMYTMKRLSGLVELDFSSEFGKMLAARCKAVYEEAKSLQLTFEPKAIQPAPVQPAGDLDDDMPF